MVDLFLFPQSPFTFICSCCLICCPSNLLSLRTKWGVNWPKCYRFNKRVSPDIRAFNAWQQIVGISPFCSLLLPAALRFRFLCLFSFNNVTCCRCPSQIHIFLLQSFPYTLVRETLEAVPLGLALREIGVSLGSLQFDI